MLVENERFAFFVTHVEADEKFLKIWAQTDEKLVHSLLTLLKPLQEKFDMYGPTNISPANLVPSTRCCARGIYNDFARARVVCVRSDGMVLVNFIDYGSMSYVPIHNIRLLDDVPEANYLFNIPETATAFALADVAPIGGAWLQDVVKEIRAILVKHRFEGMYRMVNNLKMLNFTLLSDDFSRILIEKNMAIFSPTPGPQIVPVHVPVQSLRPPHSMNCAPQENWRIQTVPQAVQPVQKVIKTNSFKALQLEIGSVHDVTISYVEEGPCKFSVQLLEALPCLNDMMEKINSQKHLPLQESPIAGTVCLGRQTSTNKLCRVILNSPGDTSCKVYYADYGHHETLHFSDIYQIPDEFVVPTICSIRFTLSGIINWNVSQEMKDYFGGLVHGKLLKLRVCQGPMSPLTQYCDLFVDGKNVKDELRSAYPDMCDFSYQEPERLRNGTRQAVFVSFVESVSKFFVQIEANLSFLDGVMDEIEKVSKAVTKINPMNVYPNMPCLALYDIDKKWYRASILSKVGNDTVKVFYVDYGNEEEVPICNLRVIPFPIVKALPKQAIQCSISGFQNSPSNMNLTKYFESLVQENLLNITVYNYIQNTAIVEAESASNRQDISTALRAFGNSKRQEIVPPVEKVQESSFKSISPKSNLKAQNPPAQKQKSKNKNVKPRDSWTAGDWEKSEWEKTGQITATKSNNSEWEKNGQIPMSKGNNCEPYEPANTKFRKDNENEQRHDNRFRKGGNDYQNGYQNNRYDKDGPKTERFGQNDKYGKGNDFYGSAGPKDYQSNDRFNRNNGQMGRASKESYGNRPSISSRLDRSFDKNSDKDSDTSSRSSGKRSNRGGRRNGDQRNKRDTPPNNRNRMGRWENEQDRSDSHQRNHNGNVVAVHPKPQYPKDNNCAPRVDQWQTSEWDTSSNKLSTSCTQETTRYMTSTPISKIPPPNITVGAVKNCVLVFYINPENFFLHLCPDSDELRDVMDKIHETYAEGGKVLQGYEIKKDLQCIAQYSEDSQWYRAIVESVDASSATVHFIDYGNSEKVSFGKIKEIESEFLKLPAQGVHCKLFCPSKTSWTNDEIDTLSNEITDKSLEAEFVTEENGVYQIIIREANSNQSKFINDLFTNGVDIVKEKEAIRNKVKGVAVRGESPPDYAALDEKWSDSKLNPGTTYDVLMAWFINPESFYCQLADQQKEFRDMMNEIQIAYSKRQPVTEPLQVGSSVIAVLPDDGVLYRAVVLELNKPRGHVVQYIDYGDRAMVDPQKIFKVDRKFMKLPKQAIFCGLKNICPTGAKWSNPAEMAKFFNAEKFECLFHEFKNDKYLISLSNNGIDVSLALFENNLAVFSSPLDNNQTLEEAPEETIEKQDLPRVDINLLEGQTLLVKVSSVEGVSKFYVQFYTADACQNTVDEFMAKKDPKVMPRLLSHQVCLGAGCLVNCRGKWRRGVVVKFTKTDYEVRLIDSGEHESVTLNSMLQLPGQLAAMQNQAMECALFDVPPSTKVNETFKKLVTGKDVKIFVENVEGNKLIVRLFDVDGNKIKLVDTQNTEKISPVCNMQILSSTHDVIMTWVNNSGSVWLQRTADAPVEGKYLDTLFEHYSKVEGSVVPEENELYAGLSADGNWYRVKATHVMESEVTVTLIDYGNVETIPVENLRKLEPQFYLPHQLALEVSLTVTLSGTDAEQINVIEPLLKDKVFTATFYNVNRSWIAELMENGEKISEKLANVEVVKETPTKKFEYVELLDMVVGEKYDVIVSYVDHPSQVWLQRKEELDAIAELQNQLQESSDEYVDFDGVPEEKSLCLAVYSFDNMWYRAEVVDSDGEITTVRFIDYGNADVIEMDKSKLKHLPEKWKAIKKYAIQCKLDVIPIENDWSEAACSRMSELVATKNAPSLQALVITDKAPMRVDLFIGEQSICKTLVEEKLAAYIQSTEELENLEDVDEVPLDPRSAFVSFLISVDEFYIHEYNLISELEMLEDRLLVAPMLPPVTEIEEGLLCIAHFPDDNAYYRAKILSHKDAETVVHYIDYGNTSVTSDLRAIPADLAQIRTLSKKCRLAKPDGVEHWPCGINKEFDKLSADGATTFLLDVIEEGETCIVKLTDKSVDVAMKLIEICAKTPPTDDEGIAVEESKDFLSEERPAPIGKEKTSEPEDCVVSFASSPSEFWIQKTKDFPDLDHLTEKLANADSYEYAKDTKEGQIVAAKFHEDNSWYRSKILSICAETSSTEVHYIDYGNCSLADEEAGLRVLPLDLLEVPAKAMHCSLRAPESPENWSEAACQKFIELVAQGATEFQVELVGESQNPNEPVQVTLKVEGQDVVDILKDVSQDEHLQENGKDEEELNVSGDSAIQSEQEQQATEIDDKQSLNEVIKESHASVEIVSDNRLCSVDLTVVEKSVICQRGEELVKADALDVNQVSTEETPTVAESCCDQESSTVENTVEIELDSKEIVSIPEEPVLVACEEETEQVARPVGSVENTSVESASNASESMKTPEVAREEPALSEKSNEQDSSKAEGSEHSAAD